MADIFTSSHPSFRKGFKLGKAHAAHGTPAGFSIERKAHQHAENVPVNNALDWNKHKNTFASAYFAGHQKGLLKKPHPVLGNHGHKPKGGI